MSHLREGKASVWILILLLLGAGGAGTWNYHRNQAAEEAEFRPYRNYDAADLTALADAYQVDHERLDTRYRSARQGLGEVKDRELLDQRVDEFERVQRRSADVRQLGGLAAERAAAVQQIQEELARREADRDATAVFLRRLLTLPEL